MGQSNGRPLGRTLESGTIAAVGSGAFLALLWLLAHLNVVLPVAVFVLGVVAIAFAAGFVSGRLRDLPSTWLGICLGYALIYWIHATLYPDWPQGEDGYEGDIAAMVVLVAPPLAIVGHGLGLVMSRVLRGRVTVRH